MSYQVIKFLTNRCQERF